MQGISKELGSLQRVAETALGFAGGAVALAAVQKGFEAIGGAAIGMNATLETSTLQFKILMGDADRAQTHVKGLFEFAKSTPFETGPIIEASRIMEVMGGTALNTKENLTLIGDAAAGASAPIQEVGMWVSRAYSNIQGGRPFGEAAMRLQELGLLSGTARAEMEKLSESGASSEQIWAALRGELGRFEGSMSELQGTWAGLTSTASDSINILLSGALEPLFELAKEGLTEFNKLLESRAVEEWGERVAATLRDVKKTLDEVNQARQEVAARMAVPQAAVGALFGITTGEDLARAAGGRVISQFQMEQLRELETMGLALDEWRARYSQTIAAIDVENEKLARSLSLQALAPDIEKDIEALGSRVMDRYRGIAEEAAAEGPSQAERWVEAMGLAETNRLIGTEGVKLIEAINKFLEDGGDKNRAAAATWAQAIMDAWSQKLDPAVAAARIAEMQAAVDAVMTGGAPDAGSLAGLLRGVGATDRDLAATDRAQRDAERQERDDEQQQRAREQARARERREQEAAVREAERIAKEYHRTKAITADLFAGAFAREDVAAGLAAGRSAFEALRKVIEDGGQANIDAVGRMAADMRERMIRELGPEQGEEWFGAFMDGVNVTIETQSVDAARNVGEIVKAFDIERQIQEATRKYETAVNVGLEDAEREIVAAQKNTQTAIDKLVAEYNFDDRIRIQMDFLQDQVRDGMKSLAEEHEAGLRALTAMREGRDLGEQERRNTIVRDERRARDRQKIEEDYQKRISEIRRRGGAGLGPAVAEAGQQYMEQKRALEERIALEDKDRQRQQAWAAQDRIIRDADRAVDRERATIIAAEQEATRARLEAPIKELQQQLRIRSVLERIAEIRRGEVETEQRLQAALENRIQQAERLLQLERMRLGLGAAEPGEGATGRGIGGSAGFRDLNVTNQFNAPIGSDEIDEAIAHSLEEAALRLAHSG